MPFRRQVVEAPTASLRPPSSCGGRGAGSSSATEAVVAAASILSHHVKPLIPTLPTRHLKFEVASSFRAPPLMNLELKFFLFFKTNSRNIQSFFIN